MEIVATVFAGLGMFFIGIRLIGSNLKQLAGRRMRFLAARLVTGRGAAAVFGLLMGAIMQSVNAVVYVLAALVAAGAIETRRTFPVIGWASVGTSMLVVIAAIKLHLLVLALIGITGLTFYFDLDQSSRYRHAIGALLGVGLLFLGIDFIKSGSSTLKSSAWLWDPVVAATTNFPLLGLGLGLVVAILVQSSSTVTVVAMAMASAGLLHFQSGALLVLGASAGSALSTWTMARPLKGSAQQLAHFLIVLKTLGTVIVLILFAADSLSGLDALERAFAYAGLSASAQLATIYVLVQVASYLSMLIVQKPVERMLERLAPPSVEESLGQVRYIDDSALVAPDSALLLADKEQQRLLARLPRYLDALRNEAAAGAAAAGVRRAAEANILKRTDQFLKELADRNHSRFVLEQTILLRDRNELLGSLQETLVELGQAAPVEPSSDDVKTLLDSMVEGLHLILEVLSDVARSPNADDLAMLRKLTHDRSELMDTIRRRIQSGGISPKVQESIFAATTLFERCIWLLRRYVLLLRLPDAEGPAVDAAVLRA